jgi:hypothetical protein
MGQVHVSIRLLIPKTLLPDSPHPFTFARNALHSYGFRADLPQKPFCDTPKLDSDARSHWSLEVTGWAWDPERIRRLPFVQNVTDLPATDNASTPATDDTDPPDVFDNDWPSPICLARLMRLGNLLLFTRHPLISSRRWGRSWWCAHVRAYRWLDRS